MLPLKLYTMLNFPFIQIAGILGEKDIETILKFENVFIGFPLVLGYHKEDISKEKVKYLIDYYKIKNRTVLITYLNHAHEIKSLLDYLGLDIVQIHSDISLNELKKLNDYKNIKIIKSLIIKNDNLQELFNQIDLQVDYINAFITDTYDETTGARGATGKPHNWEYSKKIREYSKKPLILAGGLNPDNIKEAIEIVKPFGVDSHTGLEDENGWKNYEKIKKFYDISIKYL